jgi:long-chain acyl-CoA synthetase
VTRTLAALWREAVAADRSEPAYMEERDGSWIEIPWRDAATRVDELAHGLLGLDIQDDERVAILAPTTVDWALLDWALISAGTVVVPIYPTSSAAECRHILSDSGAVAIFVGDDEQLAKIEEIRGSLPALREVISFSELDALAERGRAHALEHPDAIEQAAQKILEEDPLTIIYTSGTTGPPKGCVLTNRNYFAMAEMVAAMDDFMLPGDRTVLYLPLAHNFGRLVSFVGARIGMTVAFCPDPRKLSGALQAVQPHWFPSVPRIYEKTGDAIKAELERATGMQRRIVDWALEVGARASERRQQGRPLGPILGPQHALADRLVFAKVRAKLGGRLRFGISGGAPISQELVEYFHRFGITLLEAYGLTECTSCSINRPQQFKFGTVGLPLPGCEVRIAEEDGEILIRGEHVFAGYLNQPEATREVLDDDGWFYSGDIGEIDERGFVKITDRKKDLIATAGGKKIAPNMIENALKQTSTLISQALVVGDRRPYITALITLDDEAIRSWARAESLDPDLAALAASDRLRQMLQTSIDEVNKDLARPEQIKRFAILPRDFSEAEGEVTPTLKLKRRICLQHFEPEIEALYTGDAAPVA